MSLAKLKEKYNPLPAVENNVCEANPPTIHAAPAHNAGCPAERTVLNSWQDSAPVSRLLIYMKEHGTAAGIRVCQTNGNPRLTFNPGLVRADMKTERWQIASNAMILMQDAVDDLKDLIARGLLALPGHKKASHRAAAGPSGRPAMHGSRRHD